MEQNQVVGEKKVKMEVNTNWTSPQTLNHAPMCPFWTLHFLDTSAMKKAK